jgi:hypothetical protein
MSPLKISSEERAGEEWNISALIEPKVLKQLKDYKSYENKRGSTSIRFVGYEERSLDDLETSSSEVKLKENRRNSIYEWNAIREKEMYFRREIYRLNNIKKDRELNNKKN